MVVHDATIMAVAQGSPRDAWLLRRVVYWSRYAKVEWGGHIWIAKTQEEWSSETGMPVRQVQRAFASLRSKSVVVTEQHLFGSKAMNFTRLTAHANAALGLSKSEDNQVE